MTAMIAVAILMLTSAGTPAAGAGLIQPAVPQIGTQRTPLMAVPVRYSGPLIMAGPMDHYVGADIRSSTPVALGSPGPDTTDVLPYSFTFEVSYGIDGRDWTTSRAVACYNATVTLTSGHPQINWIYVKLWTASGKQTGPTVEWPYDGRAYQYCFTSLKNGTVYYFFQGFMTHGNGAVVYGTGSVTTS